MAVLQQERRKGHGVVSRCDCGPGPGEGRLKMSGCAGEHQWEERLYIYRGRSQIAIYVPAAHLNNLGPEGQAERAGRGWAHHKLVEEGLVIHESEQSRGSRDFRGILIKLTVLLSIPCGSHWK